MNTNPKAKRVLCYGDSNTNGRIPGPESKRFTSDIRWTGVLQNKLGSDYEIIEEGLGGRTTLIDSPNKFGKNGLSYLLPCIETHSPIDIFVISLGTNDLKEHFDLSAHQIATNFEKVIQEASDKFQIRQNFIPEFIIMSPPIVNEAVELAQENYKGAEAKSMMLGELYRKISEKYETKFIDLSKLVQPSKNDGYHLDADAQSKVAEELFNQIKQA